MPASAFPSHLRLRARFLFLRPPLRALAEEANLVADVDGERAAVTTLRPGRLARTGHRRQTAASVVLGLTAPELFKFFRGELAFLMRTVKSRAPQPFRTAQTTTSTSFPISATSVMVEGAIGELADPLAFREEAPQ